MCNLSTLSLVCWIFSDFRANSPPNHRQNVQGLDLTVQILDGLLDGRSDISQISSLVQMISKQDLPVNISKFLLSISPNPLRESIL